MNPPCAFCKKTVYPTEKFNCLDKIWHKGCFKCTECSLKLTMSTYKGFNKMPYCNAHYPKLKATQVAGSAEHNRLKKISNQQSQVLYHKDFNQAKGAKISVVDDPALKTQRAASQNQSLAAYHGLAQKKADQEMRRPAQDDEPEQVPQQKGHHGHGQSQGHHGPSQGHHGQTHGHHGQSQGHHGQNQGHHGQNQGHHGQSQGHHAQSQAHHAQTQAHHAQTQAHHAQTQAHHAQDNHRQGHGHKQQSNGTIRIPEPMFITNYSIQDASQELSIQAGQAPRKIGSIHDYPLEDEQGYAPQQQQQPPPPQIPQQQPSGGYRPPPPEPVQAQPRGPVFRAMYDYAAADTDEVSFAEGDIIINTEAIDEGWMTGTVERTGETGNYNRGGGYQQQPPSQPSYQQPPPSQPSYQQQPPSQPSYQQPPPSQPAYQPPPPSQPDYDYDPEPVEPPAAPQADYDQQPEQGGGDMKRFKALYDYTADDADEVSFQEDDIFEGTIIDEGWLDGTVCSTGAVGMAPRNYFEEL